MTKVLSGGSKLIYCKYSWKKAATKLQIRLVQALHCLIKGIEREVAGPQKKKLMDDQIAIVHCTLYSTVYSVQYIRFNKAYISSCSLYLLRIERKT